MSAQRVEAIQLIDEARASGARQSKACAVVGISAKTYQRWGHPENEQDGRLHAKHAPTNQLTELERQRMITLANEPEYADLSPSKIVPKLADEGRYLASESSFYRVLKAHKQLSHRHQSKPSRVIKKPRALTATAPNQLYSWDITYLPTAVRGLFFYLYLTAKLR